jgi:hypothetical protein
MPKHEGVKHDKAADHQEKAAGHQEKKAAEHLKKAAGHYEKAAQHHKDAAKHREENRHETTAHSAQLAQEHINATHPQEDDEKSINRPTTKS